MKTVMRPRYYCDHCNKGTGSPSFMRRHEPGCTANPNRVCGMCRKLAEEGGPEPAPPRDELLNVLDAQGFKAMCDVANNCPACILSALRTQNRMSEETGPYMAGPEDGREKWSYRQAKEDWWKDWNQGQFEREHPY